MFFASTGGIFLRLDSSGNLNVYDTSGTSIAKFLSGAFSTAGNVGSLLTNTPIATTASTSAVSTGYGALFTPQVKGRAVIICEVNTNNNTVNDGALFSIWQNAASTILSGGTAQTGTNLTASQLGALTSATANARGDICLIHLPTLTVGTQYTFTLAVQAVTGGTVGFNIQNNHPLVWEI